MHNTCCKGQNDSTLILIIFTGKLLHCKKNLIAIITCKIKALQVNTPNQNKSTN